MRPAPIDTLPGFRRRFIVTPASDRVRSEVEDDYHCMGVTLHHDREACTRIEAVDSNNAPTTIASKSFPRFSIFASLLFLLTCFLS